VTDLYYKFNKKRNTNSKSLLISKSVFMYVIVLYLKFTIKYFYLESTTDNYEHISKTDNIYKQQR